MSSDWPAVPLNEILQPIERREEVVPGKVYRQIGVKLWGMGAYERELLDGSQTRYKTLSSVEADDVIVNKIWARNGSVAVVTENLAGCYGSNEFPTFAPIREKMVPRWFHWFTKTAGFWSQCDEKSRGTSGKNRIRPERFLEIEIPLPPLDEQRRTVARIEELAAKIEEAQTLRRQAVEEAKVLDRQFYGLAWSKSEKTSNFKLLGEIADVIDPQPDHRTPPEFSDGMPYVSIKNIDPEGNVDILNARKVSPDVIKLQESSFTLKTGDIVLGKIGTIGAARALKVNGRFALSANVVLVQPNRDQILDTMLLLLLRAPQIEKQFEKGSRKTAQTAFGIKKMRKLRVPLVPLEEQRRIVSRLDELQAQVDGLKKHQVRTAEELDALLPSVLDRAFRGQL